MEMKSCQKCKIEKPKTDEYFYRKKGYLTSPCKDCQQKKQAHYHQKHKITNNDSKHKQKLYRSRNQQKLAKRKKVQRSESRLLALWHYGGQPPSCSCCGEKRINFLCVSDTSTKQSINSHRLYKTLRAKKYPKGYKVFCFNCIHSLITFGECPHKQDRALPSS